MDELKVMEGNIEKKDMSFTIKKVIVGDYRDIFEFHSGNIIDEGTFKLALKRLEQAYEEWSKLSKEKY